MVLHYYRHFTVEFLVGERLEHLKRSHLALEADDLIPEDVMQHVYGKEPERQVRLFTSNEAMDWLELGRVLV